MPFFQGNSGTLSLTTTNCQFFDIVGDYCVGGDYKKAPNKWDGNDQIKGSQGAAASDNCEETQIVNELKFPPRFYTQRGHAAHASNTATNQSTLTTSTGSVSNPPHTEAETVVLQSQDVPHIDSTESQHLGLKIMADWEMLSREDQHQDGEMESSKRESGVMDINSQAKP
ncbi:hypothetical protein BDZ94DRAFT_1270278 [Collybia nuda]|uniref:Uncharacterized protein n=1 Tax=Collybia nuda TaxID=64659 RepID=A0A9P6CF13_9AGAR|nr:hypothetical protein BDZ94DRAFT_1270278 [Collybia nuda]